MNDFAENGLTPRRGRPPLNRDMANQPAGNAAVDQIAAMDNTTAPRPAARRPFSSVEYKLSYEARTGFRRHWFNEVGDRIHRAQEAGYDHVKGRDGQPVVRTVGVAEGGGPLRAYLMEIPEEWYKEDMAREQVLINEKESSIKRGALTGNEVEKGYIPAQGISIRQGR